MRFTTDLIVPRGDDSTGIPVAWIRDASISFSARGFLGRLLSYAEPGIVVEQDTVEGKHPDELPTVLIVADLVAAGYLIAEGDGLYRLVHPDRFEPLPAVAV